MPVATMIAAIGLSHSDPGREAAMSSYWSWRRANTEMVDRRGDDALVEASVQAWLTTLRRAALVLRTVEDPTPHLAGSP